MVNIPFQASRVNSSLIMELKLLNNMPTSQAKLHLDLSLQCLLQGLQNWGWGNLVLRVPIIEECKYLIAADRLLNRRFRIATCMVRIATMVVRIVTRMVGFSPRG